MRLLSNISSINLRSFLNTDPSAPALFARIQSAAEHVKVEHVILRPLTFFFLEVLNKLFGNTWLTKQLHGEGRRRIVALAHLSHLQVAHPHPTQLTHPHQHAQHAHPHPTRRPPHPPRPPALNSNVSLINKLLLCLTS